MINQVAVNKFLGRKLDSWDFIKKSGDVELGQAVHDYYPYLDCSGAFSLWKHQAAAIVLVAELQRFMLHIEMGGGKTLITLATIKGIKRNRVVRPRALILVPYITSVDTWVEECSKYTPDLKCVPLLGTSKDNLKRLNDDGDLFVACYQSAVAMVKEVVPNAKKPGRQKWSLKPQHVRELFQGFNMLVCDEIHRAKDSNSLTYRMARAISGKCQWVLGLTGTPFGRDLIDLWPQFHLIDFGETLGPSLGFYRSIFFTSKVNYWGGLEWQFKKRMLPQLKRMLKHRSIHYGVDEFADIPSKQYNKISMSVPDTTRGYCEASLKAITEAVKSNGKGRYREVESNYLKLRQLSSGFMTLYGEDNARLHLKFEANPKLDVLQGLVEELPDTNKMVVFHHFVYTNQMLSERLTQMKVGHARVWSGQKDPIGEVRRFKNDPKCRVLVINSKSGSSSLNLQIANYVVFFEQPDSPIDRQQAEARVWRSGQTRRTFIYDLFVRDTKDKSLWLANKEGRDLLQQLLKGEAEL